MARKIGISMENLQTPFSEAYRAVYSCDLELVIHSISYGFNPIID